VADAPIPPRRQKDVRVIDFVRAIQWTFANDLAHGKSAEEIQRTITELKDAPDLFHVRFEDAVNKLLVDLNVGRAHTFVVGTGNLKRYDSGRIMLADRSFTT